MLSQITNMLSRAYLHDNKKKNIQKDINSLQYYAKQILINGLLLN